MGLYCRVKYYVGLVSKLLNQMPLSCAASYLLLVRAFFMLMKFLERNLEDIVFNTPNRLLDERGLPIFGKKLRQVSLAGWGISDIITVHRYKDKRLRVTVYELKKDTIGVDAFFQGLRYLQAVKFYCNSTYPTYKIEYDLCLIGSQIQEGSFRFLPGVFENIIFYTYSYDFDGIHFHVGEKQSSPRSLSFR